MTGRSGQELAASKLRSAVAVNHATGDKAAHRDGVLERLDGRPGLHPRVNRVSHHLVREHFVDRAEVELALERERERALRIARSTARHKGKA